MAGAGGLIITTSWAATTATASSYSSMHAC
jgi:hypothetical protein